MQANLSSTSARPRFPLDSEACELLAALAHGPSLAELGRIVGRDPSVVSRQLQRVASDAPVLEKRDGRWRLSALGETVALWTREAVAAQRQLLAQRPVIRIASTREFGARVLAPQMDRVFASGSSGAPRPTISLVTHEDGVEDLLLRDEADLGFDCGLPRDPAVLRRGGAKETFAVVASPAFLKRHGPKRPADVVPLPHLQYRRASASRLLKLSFEVPDVVAVFNDIAAVREACVAGHGWAVVPLYAVRREVRAKELRVLKGWAPEPEKFGVLWLRRRTDLVPWATSAAAWVGEQDLATV